MDMLKLIEDMPNQIKEGARLAKDIKLSGDVDSIVVCGMGGSGIAGDVLKTALRDAKVPVYVNKSYTMPGFVGKRTLAFVLSYSGNTEEALSCLSEASRRGAQIVVITTGGRLKLAAMEKKVVEIIIIPQGMPPRSAIAYLFFPMLIVAHKLKIISLKMLDLEQTIKTLKNPELNQKAEELSEQLIEKIPIVYCSDAFEAVALRWKQAFNETAKVHAFANTFPEQNHNEIMAFESDRKDFYVIMLRDEKDHAQVKKRMALTRELLKSKGIAITELMLRGDSLIAKLFTAIYLGDLTAYYLSQRRGVDPAETRLIEEIKKKL